MKLRVSLRRDAQPPTLVQIVADGTATASDVAVAIASAGMDEPVSTQGRPLTLQVEGDWRVGRTLSPDTPLAESGVCSGSTLAVVQDGRGGTRDQPGAMLKVIGGPDSGTEVQLRVGGSSIGRNSDCDVRLKDPRVSKRHAKILVGRQIEIIDDNSANGVLLSGQKVTRAVLTPGDTALLGDTYIQVSAIAGAAIADTDTEVRYLRPPVVQSRPKEDEIELPEVPQPRQKGPFPWLAMLAPLIMGGVIFAITRSPLTIVFVAMSPLLMLGNYVGNVVDSRRKFKLALANFREAMDAVEAEIIEARVHELRQLHKLFPSVSECVNAAANRDTHLWCRRPEHPEFMQVRLGTGSVEAAARIKPPGRRGVAALVREQKELAERHRLVEHAPIVANLRSAGGVGLAGEHRFVVGLARGAVAQAAIMQSPSEMVIACLTSSAMKENWSWLEWVPHCSSPHSPIPGTLLASDAARGRALVDQIEELIDVRSDAKAPALRGPIEDKEKFDAPVTPSLLVVVHDAAVSSERLANIAERGPDVGVHVLWVAAERSGLPAACRTYLEINDEDGATVGMVRSEYIARNVTTETVDLDTALVTARSLAPVVDASTPVSDDSDLPRMVSVLGLLGNLDAVDPQQVVLRWQENGSLVDRSGPIKSRERAGDLRAVVGHSGHEPFTLDLRSQGPHALVGGTTGSGKSEFLQAWVLGMAHAHSPDRVTFLFVDYKGGAAFAKCVQLPHSVGLVTDLSTYLVRRALRSLRAEIKRREHLFNDKGVKDLVDFEKTGDPDCPPSLIIVVDEFAALVGEVPEFVDGVIDVAQRGRSLGLHLILATQRPAGVIKDSLRANTNLRIALRMNDAHDSTDVLGTAEASTIDPATPGRGVARVGPGRLIPFQSAFPGARTPAEPPTSPIDLLELHFGAGAPWKIPRPKATGTAVEKDIERVVEAVAAAAELGRVRPPHRPWLERLAPTYDLTKLRQRRDDEILLGVVDDPDNQQHFTEYYRPDIDGNILFIGGGGSGKSTALRSLALASALTPRTGPVHVYGFDFTGRGLASLEVMPNVGSIIPGTDSERVSRLIRMLTDTVDERAIRFAEVNASSLPEYRTLSGKHLEPRLLVIFDGFGNFEQEYNGGPAHLYALFSALARVMAEGRAVGVHFAVTIDRPNAMSGAVSSAFSRRVVLRQASENAYLDLGVPKDVLDINSPQGRAMQVHSPQELQIATLGGRAEVSGQVKQMKDWAASMAPHHIERPAPIRSLPTELRVSELPAASAGKPVLAMSDLTLGPLTVPGQGVVMVAGGSGSGKSNAMAVYAASLKKAFPGIQLIHMAPQRTSISALRLWEQSALGVSEVNSLSSGLFPAAGTAKSDVPQRAIFVEGATELGGSGALESLVRVARGSSASGDLFVAEGATDQWSKVYDLLQVFRSSGTALLLEPGQDDGFTLLNAQLPKVNKAEMVTGRGFWIHRGSATKVQVPLYG